MMNVFFGRKGIDQKSKNDKAKFFKWFSQRYMVRMDKTGHSCYSYLLTLEDFYKFGFPRLIFPFLNP